MLAQKCDTCYSVCGVYFLEFHKRFVILDNNVLTYYESEQSRAPKDSIESSEMTSVTSSSDDRQQFTFELATTRHNGRVYLFAAETLAERQRWVNYIAKVRHESTAIEKQ